MSSRISEGRLFPKTGAWALPCLAILSACGVKQGPLKEGQAIACRPPGETVTTECTVDSMKTPEGIALTIRHPDGSFRRLLQVKDGRGVIAADGAEQAVVKAANDKAIQVAIDGGLYQLPARIKP